MKLSAKSDYAIRAVFWLAQHYLPGTAWTVEEMAAAQEIPAKYLVQILIELKSARIVLSQRGKQGGYLLARAPAEITFGDVIRCVQGEMLDASPLKLPNSCAELSAAWDSLQQTLDRAANSINFQQLVENAARREKMYYI